MEGHSGTFPAHLNKLRIKSTNCRNWFQNANISMPESKKPGKGWRNGSPPLFSCDVSNTVSLTFSSALTRKLLRLEEQQDDDRTGATFPPTLAGPLMWKWYANYIHYTQLKYAQKLQPPGSPCISNLAFGSELVSLPPFSAIIFLCKVSTAHAHFHTAGHIQPDLQTAIPVMGASPPYPPLPF